MTDYTVTRGPLTANLGDPRTGKRMTHGNAVPVGTRLAGTGNAHGVWVEARTPWQVKNGGAAWFHKDYITPTTATTQTADPVQVQLNAWLPDVLGKRLDPDGRYGAQCVDVAKDWAARFGVNPSGSIGNGVDVARNLIATHGWQKVTPADVRPGDVISFGKPYGVSSTGAVYGHVVVVTDVLGGNRVRTAQQDGFTAGTTTHYKDHTLGSSVTGIARPPQSKVSTSAQPSTHTITKGDTLWGLTRKYGISLAALRDLNPGIQADNLRVGQKVAVSR